MDCFVAYDWADPAQLLRVNQTQLDPIVGYLQAVASQSVVPAVRIPLTASSWLGTNTTASAGNMAKYPDLGGQYRRFISALVQRYTSAGIVAIADLHWCNDDAEQQPMADRTALAFWDSVAAQFGSNDLVFYELYNEPHITDQAAYARGDATHAGMLEMLAAVRKHTANPVIVAGAAAFAYDSASLVQLDAALKQTSARNVLFNYHPYMGPAQAGATNKCPAGFETMLAALFAESERPAIITEFGQACCATDGACESCPATYGGATMGYDEAILTICSKLGVSWLPWAWRSGASGWNAKTCQDLNGAPGGASLGSPPDGKGADFAKLWARFASGGAPSPPPSPGCPGGSISACIAMCPSSPPQAYKACTEQCAERCG